MADLCCMGLIAAEGYLKVQFLRKKGVIIDLTSYFLCYDHVRILKFALKYYPER
jgi:hypothetical protein